ncbi:MAG: NAD(P)-dependent oxidoreductase [Ruminococcaceae bacterium]|nr:NAD(P)-dependent oxidoreductase [Oscillospiraceae bacterium]
MWNEEKLNELLTTPSDKLVADVAKIKGDIMILGAGGKMGPTLCLLAKNAIKKAGIEKRVIAVSRFGDSIALDLLHSNGIETISCDLLDRDSLESLPEVENVIYMAGRKFGTDGQEYLTWAMNATLPAFVAYKFRKSNIVVFSSGNIYPIVPVHTGGCTEDDKVGPIGEYAMSCLARERAFEYAANQYGTNVFIYRLNFAVDLRYGVLYDCAKKIMDGAPISLATPCFNFIWQGSANEIAIRALLHCATPAVKMNVTGPETVSIKSTAIKLGKLLGKEPLFEGEPQGNAYLSNASRAVELFGYPEVSAETLIRWQAEYILDGGRTLDKPTHFEERKGSY